MGSGRRLGGLLYLRAPLNPLLVAPSNSGKLTLPGLLGLDPVVTAVGTGILLLARVILLDRLTSPKQAQIPDLSHPQALRRGERAPANSAAPQLRPSGPTAIRAPSNTTITSSGPKYSVCRGLRNACCSTR